MESFGTFFDEEWHGLIRTLVADHDSDHGFVSNVEHGHGFTNVFSNDHDQDSFIVDEESLVCVSDNINPNFYQYLSQESSSDNGMVFLPYPCQESFLFYPSNSIAPSPPSNDQSSDFCMMDQAHVVSDDGVGKEGRMGNSHVLKRKLEMVEVVGDEVNNEKEKNPKKKRKNKKNVQPNENMKMEETEKGNNGERNRQSSSSCSSEEDMNGSQELNETINSNKKTRASRGTATDPQSLYARKRRERINERLRILQNLVPNGTKVDISTMLEEAVEYVKFLKLQIQLLSSDEMWMYAPIAYNGMDMGLYQSITPTL